MGMDSVEIVLGWEASFGVRLPDELVSHIRTPRQAIDLISSLLPVAEQPGPSLIQRAFAEVRAVLMAHFNVPKSAIRPDSRFSALLPKKGQTKHWRKFQKLMGVQSFTVTFSWPIFTPSGTTIKDVCIQMVALNGQSLIDKPSGWTLNQVEEVVRYGIVFQLGVKEFDNDADFVLDIDID